jgi:hypothetical protein
LVIHDYFYYTLKNGFSQYLVKFDLDLFGRSGLVRAGPPGGSRPFRGVTVGMAVSGHPKTWHRRSENMFFAQAY